MVKSPGQVQCLMNLTMYSMYMYIRFVTVSLLCLMPPHSRELFYNFAFCFYARRLSLSTKHYTTTQPSEGLDLQITH